MEDKRQNDRPETTEEPMEVAPEQPAGQETERITEASAPCQTAENTSTTWDEEKPEGSAPAEEFPEVVLEPIQDLGVDEPRPRPARNAKKKSKRRKKKEQRITIIALLASVVLVAIGILTFMFVTAQRQKAAEIAAQLAAEEALRLKQEQQQAEFESMANSTVFLQGITVDGVAIGGMTMAEAKEALIPAVEAAGKRGELQLSLDGKLYSLDMNPLLSASNLDDVLSDAYSLGKTGDYAGMKAESEDVKVNGRSFSLTAGVNLTGLRAKVAELAAQIDAPAQNATVSHVDTENRTIEFTDATVGVSVLQEDLVQAVMNLMESGKSEILAIPAINTDPIITKTDLAAKYVMRGSATTSFSGSSKDRKYNIRKGAGLINGTILKPDDTFSTNDTLGTRTEGRGWRMAGAYENGATVEQAGGGVCQLSSTLYNAAVKSDLEIVSRRNHSMPVGYIDKGLDATINSVGNIIDFKFKNNTGSDLVVFAYTDGNDLTFEIWGVPFATDEYDQIKLTSKKTSEIEPDSDPIRMELPEGTEKPDGSLLMAGEEYVAVTPRKGYRYQSYKNYYKAGTLVRTEELASSTYKAYNGEIWVCITPGVLTPTPDMTTNGVYDAGAVDAGAVTPYMDPVLLPDSNAFYN